MGRSQQHGAVSLIHPRKHLRKLAKLMPLLPARAPQQLSVFGRRLRRFLRRFLTVVKEPVEWNLKRLRIRFQRPDGRDGISIFDAGGVAAYQARALFNITLTEIPRLPQFPNPSPNLHGCTLRQGSKNRQSFPCGSTPPSLFAGTVDREQRRTARGVCSREIVSVQRSISRPSSMPFSAEAGTAEVAAGFFPAGAAGPGASPGGSSSSSANCRRRFPALVAKANAV